MECMQVRSQAGVVRGCRSVCVRRPTKGRCAFHPLAASAVLAADARTALGNESTPRPAAQQPSTETCLHREFNDCGTVPLRSGCCRTLVLDTVSEPELEAEAEADAEAEVSDGSNSSVWLRLLPRHERLLQRRARPSLSSFRIRSCANGTHTVVGKGLVCKWHSTPRVKGRELSVA